MKKYITLLILSSCFLSISFAESKEELSYATEILYRKIAYMDQLSFRQETFAELGYLKRNYKLDSFKLNDSKYIAKLNDYYYKRFYPYKKLLDENAIVTEDCFAEESFAPYQKNLFYSINSASKKLPKDIIAQIEKSSEFHEFYGPYFALTNIYFLKKFNNNSLSKTQKDKLATVEKFLCTKLYTKYLQGNQPWSYYKILSLKVLRMNDFESTKEFVINDLIKYIIINKDLPFDLSDADKNNLDLMNKVGYKEALEQEVNAVLWIFLLELNKN